MAPLLGIGLSLLPQIPKMWDAVAGLFGKSVPKSIEEAGKLAGSIMGKIQKGEVPPEQMVALEARIMENKETIMKLQNEKEQMYLKDDQHKRDTHVQLWANEAASTDIEVKRTRPKILRQMWKTCQVYIFLVVVVYGAAMFMPIEYTTEVVKDGVAIQETTILQRDMSGFTAIVKYLGAFLFGTFTTGFLGYTAARTIDKKNPDAKNGLGVGAKLLQGFLK